VDLGCDREENLLKAHHPSQGGTSLQLVLACSVHSGHGRSGCEIRCEGLSCHGGNDDRYDSLLGGTKGTDFDGPRTYESFKGFAHSVANFYDVLPIARSGLCVSTRRLSDGCQGSVYDTKASFHASLESTIQLGNSSH
jgi:hypothetical protein